VFHATHVSLLLPPLVVVLPYLPLLLPYLLLRYAVLLCVLLLDPEDQEHDTSTVWSLGGV
jgi:hypothetical protein